MIQQKIDKSIEVIESFAAVWLDRTMTVCNALSEAPVIFMKPDTALLAPGAKFEYPSFTSDLHYEIELVLRIDTTLKTYPLLEP